MRKWIDLAILLPWLICLNVVAMEHLHPVVWALFCLGSGWVGSLIWRDE